MSRLRWALATLTMVVPLCFLIPAAPASAQVAVPEMACRIAGSGGLGFGPFPGPATFSEFGTIVDIAVASDGSVFVADFGFIDSVGEEVPGGIVGIDAGGTASVALAEGTLVAGQEFAEPTDIAVNDFGDMFFVASQRNLLGRLRSDGVLQDLTTLLPGSGYLPIAVDAGPDRSAYVSGVDSLTRIASDNYC